MLALVGLAFGGPIAFMLARGRAAFRPGLAAGTAFAWLSLAAALWRTAAVAWRMLGWFSGSFFLAVVPWLLAASLALVGWALLDEDARRAAPTIVGALLIAWMLPSQVALWRLRSAWGLGPTSLSIATGVPSAAAAERVAIAWLRPDKSGAPDSLQALRVSAGDVDASPASLERLYKFVEARRGRAIFAKQAVDALRKGWLMRWDADRALQAAMLSYPRLPPDYRTALGLIRAGPVVLERYTRLNALADMAKASSAGFEDVNQSQLIFEAFSAAYARFGDEENARTWIQRVDNLRPIYDKKVEIAPLEGFHDGAIEGSVREGGAPASNVLVGLFFVASSTASLDSGVLSQSSWPDEQGRFSFSNLGAGTYYLGVMGRPEDVRAPVESSPSLISVSAEAPTVSLPPIDLP